MEINNYSNKELISRLWAYVLPFKWLVVGSFLISLLLSLLQAVALPLFQYMLNIVFGKELSVANTDTGAFLSEYKESFYSSINYLIYVPDDPSATLLKFGILIVSLFIIKNIVRIVFTWFTVLLQQSVAKSIRDDLFGKITSLSIDFFSRSKQGNIISVISNDLSIAHEFAINSSVRIIKESFSIILYIFILLALSPKLTLIALTVSFVTVFIIAFSNKHLKKYASRIQQTVSDITSAVQEGVSGIKVIQAYNAQNTVNESFFAKTKYYLQQTLKHALVKSTVPSIGEILGILALCVVLIVGGDMSFSGEMDSSELITFILVLFAIMAPVNVLTNTIAGYARGFVASSRIFTLMDQKTSVKSGGNSVDIFSDSIKIKDLSFRYEKELVLDKINIEIKKGQKIAFVGGSGSGKSTILDLILRFYDPQSGQIIFDGKNIKSFKKEAYRKIFGMVSQDTILFNDTVEKNLRLGNRAASDEQIQDVLKTANALDFVNKLESGVNQSIGDRGVTLSGGERQRLAIARALISDPEILVFDEATSALDSESEKTVQDAINHALKGKTAIIVAHRLATILDADKIYVFENGKIVEEGTHGELLSLDKTYKKLYNIQFGK
jgi:ABC-type multidrug transport system fused ATPase/permease subunit